jgi:hypothetical protein
VKTVYSFSSDGVGLHTRIDASGDWPEELPRVGLVAHVPEDLQHVEWFGRGPIENYADTNLGLPVGLFHVEAVDQLTTHYLKPQENGARSDCEFVALRGGGSGAGLLVSGRPEFSFTASRYTAEDLTAAMHPHELVRRPFTVLHLDHRQDGIGTNSCGPGPLPTYQLRPGTWEFSFLFTTLANGADALRRYRSL